LHSIDDLFMKATGEIRQWEQILANVGEDPEFDSDGGPTVQLNIRYTTADKRFLIRTQIVSRAPGITYSLSLFTGYIYEDDLDLDRDTAIDFIESTLGPAAFARIGEMLFELAEKTGQGHPLIPLPRVTEFLRGIRDADDEDLLLNVVSTDEQETPSPDESTPAE